MRAGVDAYLAECGQPDFRRIALEEAPVALGWARWEIEEKYFLSLTTASIRGLADAASSRPAGRFTARMFLAASGEAWRRHRRRSDPDEERQRAGALVMRFLEGLRQRDLRTGSGTASTAPVSPTRVPRCSTRIEPNGALDTHR